MHINYKTKTTIHADPEVVWAAITETDFTKDYFPEIKKDLSAMGEYVQRTHPRRDTVSPDYVIPGQAMGWTNGAGTNIRLAKKDLHANFESIDIKIKAQGQSTTLTFEINYNPSLNNNYIFTHLCVWALMRTKLNLLKQDIEAKNDQFEWNAAIA